MGQKTKYYRNETSDQRLSKTFYTLKELSAVIGVHHNTLHGRMAGGDVIRDKHVSAAQVPNVWPIFEREVDKISSVYLKRAL